MPASRLLTLDPRRATSSQHAALLPTILLGCPCPRSPRGFAQNPRVGCMQWPRRALLPGRRPRPLPSRFRDRAGSRPGTQNKVTNEGHKPKRRRAAGLQEEGRGSPGGRGGHPVKAAGLGGGEWRGRGEGGGDGHGGTRGRRKQSCSVGQIFCCFIRFSVNRLALARTGVRRGVLKRARARERNGHRQLPGLHFAVIICTNSS